MATHKCLYYSVLACAASHIHLIDMSSPMQELALTYYSKAVQELSQLLTTTPRLESHNGVLMTVMLLYIHGVSIDTLLWRAAVQLPLHMLDS